MSEPQTPEPQTIAILGASADRSKFGNKCVRAYLKAGWTVWPINPKADTIEGRPVYAKLSDLPATPDRISVYLPPSIGAMVMPELAEAGAPEVFFNPGAADHRVMSLARELGVAAIQSCAIVDIGLTPSQFPD
jgi:hypothetical protein